MPLDKRWLISLQGKEFVLFAGLLDLAHQQGLKSLTAELVQAPSSENGNLAIFRAEAEFDDGRSFVGHGDASTANVNPRIAPHFLRMAETRAYGRCLRIALNIGVTMLEELGDEADAAPQPKSNVAAPPPRTAPREAGHKGGQVQPQEKRFTMPDGRELTLKQILTGWERAERDALAAGIEPPELDLLVCEPEDIYRAGMELARRVSEARKAAAAA